MSVITKDLGAATAYGYAVEKGYTGTEEEFAELMASYATVGQTAVDAKDAAVAAKTAAQTAATIATNKASEATTAAQTASTKASEAGGCVETATQKATEASQSASQALGYKNDAESAKTASQTAQGLAESARDSAVQAKTDAESAKADAESARDEAQQAVASISGALAEKAPVITDTASGSIASFSDGADDLPLKSLVIDINPIQDLSHGDPSPENICPISGWTEVDVEQSGKNLFDESVFADYGGTLLTSGVWHFNTLVDLLGKTLWTAPSTVGQITVTMWRKQGGVGSQGIKLVINYTDGSSVKVGNINSTGGTDVYTLTTDASKTVQDITGDYGSNQSSTDINVVICIGSTATPYEPYTGRSITINLGQTVYGGRLDVLSGVLTVNKAMVDLGDLSWTLDGTRFKASVNGMANKAGRTIQIECSIFKSLVNGEPYDATADNICYGAYRTVYVHDFSYTDATAFTTAVSGQTLVYELATPLTIQLTPNQLNSLYGVNNICADSGDTEVVYRADTKLFIERLTAPDSVDMIADANITSGKYFMVGNSLYKATANIANGSAIVVGTNCIRKSLSEALNEINA